MSYPYSSLYLESQWAKLRLAQQFCSALGLLCETIRPDGIASRTTPRMKTNFSSVEPVFESNGPRDFKVIKWESKTADMESTLNISSDGAMLALGEASSNSKLQTGIHHRGAERAKVGIEINFGGRLVPGAM